QLVLTTQVQAAVFWGAAARGRRAIYAPCYLGSRRRSTRRSLSSMLRTRFSHTTPIFATPLGQHASQQAWAMASVASIQERNLPFTPTWAREVAVVRGRAQATAPTPRQSMQPTACINRK